MINGEEAREISSDVTSPDPHDCEGPNFDDGDASSVLSDYSSCGESELERYCNANSVMGAEGLCSSLGTCNDHLDSDLGFGARFRKNSSDRGSASLGGFDYSSDGRVESCKEKGDVGISVSALESRAICSENDVENVNNLQSKDDCVEENAEGLMLGGESDRGTLSVSVEHNSLEEISTVQNYKEMCSNFVDVNGSNVLQSVENSSSYVASCGEKFTRPCPNDTVQSHESTSASGVSVHGKEVGRFTEADEEISARYKHSDDERSSIDYGTDEERNSIRLSDKINLRYYHKVKTDDENPLFINSAVAFGSDDWDMFEQEAEESSLTPVLLDETQERQQQHVETERNLLSSTLRSYSGSPIFGVSGQVENMEEIPISRCQAQATNKSIECLESCSVSNVLTLQDLSVQKAPARIDLNIVDGTTETELQSYVASCGEKFTRPGPNDAVQSHELTSASGVSVEGKEVGKFTEADEEISARYEHSDDERSSVDYGMDDEQSIRLSDRINLRYYHKGKTDDENPLFINSAVAFGSDDWDRFEQEAEESSFTPVLLDGTQEQQQQHGETERNLLSSTLRSYCGSPIFGVSGQVENMEEIPINRCQAQATNKSIECLESCSVSNVLTLQDLSVQKAPAGLDLKIMDGTAEKELQYIIDKEMSSLGKSEVVKGDLLGISELRLQLDPLSITAVGQLCSIATETPQDNVAGDLQNDVKGTLPSMVENDQETFLKRMVTDSSVSKDPGEVYMTSNEAENIELNEFYDEVVHDMEEILLDSVESPVARFTMGNRASLSQPPKPFRDGSLTASTSGTDDAYPQVQQPLKIDGIEVVGAKQKKGEVSLGERLVGVKEYTVYRLRVWSGNDQWEVERRYRDFISLSHQLKTFFADKGQVLPSPWLDVERESRRIFGNASPDVVTQRSALIQDCLRSIRHFGFSFSASSPLIWFLSPQRALTNSSMLNTLVPLSPSEYGGETSTQGVSTLGKTISLLVEVPPHKSMKQLLEAQHYSCAGCYRYFNEGKTLLKEFVETFGWGKPRLCEYTAQLFCASCHNNDTAILPARVLHFWDFTQYPVSQLAKSYLESIYDQPMLCVSAVNPFLFSRVPALLHITGIRKKIGSMLPYVHCPFRRSIYRGLGSRRYLVESNDFFALRDLVDLSKGAFAALPVMVENVSKRISEHITEQCLICCDVGVPCGARQACEDPSSLIFPFQEVEIERCRSCESVFHEACFRKLRSCPCSVDLEVEHHGGPTDNVKCIADDEVDAALDLSATKSTAGSTMGFLTGLFSRVGSEKTLGPRDNSTVILMGSLPSNSL